MRWRPLVDLNMSQGWKFSSQAQPKPVPGPPPGGPPTGLKRERLNSYQSILTERELATRAVLKDVCVSTRFC